MINAPQSIPLLRFCVGSMHFAIAAEDVVAVAPPRDSAVHIGTLLGLEPDPRDCRVIHLASGSEHHEGPPLVAFQADSPVDVIRLSSDDLLPLPAAIPPDHWKPVIGFAQVSARAHARQAKRARASAGASNYHNVPEAKPAQSSAGASRHLILLLDIPSVIAKLIEIRRGGPF